MILLIVILAIDLTFLLVTALFTYEALRERESRAARIGFLAIISLIFVAFLALLAPSVRLPIAILMGVTTLGCLTLFIPVGPNQKALLGTSGHVVSDVKPFD